MAMKNDPIDDSDAANQELRRKSLLGFLNSDEPAWHDEDHPDIVALGTAEYVRALRNETSGRGKSIESRFPED
jgi:hypothetical protein